MYLWRQSKALVRILQVCKKVPFPPKDGETIAIWHHTRTFALASHEVTVAALNTRKHYVNPNQLTEAAAQLAEIHTIDIDTRPRITTLLQSIALGSSPQVERFYSSRFAALLRQLVQQKDFDIIQLEGSYLLRYVPLLRPISRGKIILRSHNIEHRIWEELYVAEPSRWRRVLLRFIAKSLKSFEQKHLNVCDAVVAISEQDAEVYRKMGCCLPLLVSEVGIMVPKQRPALPVQPRLFFIGSLDWSPNLAGLLHFLKSIWPEIRRAAPTVRFHVAGRNFPDWLYSYQSDGIVMEGEVADARAFMEQGSVLVVPIYAGSGIRVKIAEALALGRVVVSTSLGAQGLSGAESPVVVQQTDEGMAAAIIELFRNSQRLEELSMRSHAFAQMRLSDVVLAEQLLNFYKSLLS
ncbi:MAG: glycosyltransferase family 4 protein [Chitinophagales bacterium]|nr:glycosyltransferase family 4 protein [Chitinophagales bacterium]MDW8427490.1 glycosyltransferase family 4 protein [Chitinophagales bacterium]